MTQYPSLQPEKLVTVVDLAAMKRRGEKIACLTAYDASFSAVLDEAGVDLILVGDSLGMVIQGRDTTLPVTLDDMVYHTRCVAGARKRALVLADLPFMTYPTPQAAAESAARLMREAGAQMIKLEGFRPEIIRFVADQGIPVCGHLGLLPQSINQLGSYRVQGKESDAAAKMIGDAKMLEQAGIGLLVLECVPSKLAAEISRELTVPVIGIGAGVECDGQVLVLYDMLDIGIGRRPSFSKNYIKQAGTVEGAVKAYVEDVKNSKFPAPEHGF
ncbi:MAG: 3-methyl-2-oxobutanoate hydroxymethyltransferase [Gammaproteobacteria bacterium]